MKRKILLLILTLGFLGRISAQQTKFEPQMLDNGFIQMPSPHKFTASINETENKAINLHVDVTTPRKGGTDPTDPNPNAPKVDIVLDYDTVSQTAVSVAFLNKDVYLLNYQLGVDQLQKGSNVMSVPAGTYEIWAEFRGEYIIEDPSLEESWKPVMRVIREQMIINGDTTINISAQEAKNHINFQTLTIDGEPVNTGKWMFDENWNYIQLEQGNTDDMIYLNYMLCSDIGRWAYLSGNVGTTFEGDVYRAIWNERYADFFVNDVSDRYIFNSYRIAQKDQEFYTSSYEAQGASDNVTITNDPTKFMLFEDPFLVTTRQEDDYYLSYQISSRARGVEFINGEINYINPIEEDETIKYYLSASPSDSQYGFVHLIQPAISIKTIEMMPWGGEREVYTPVIQSAPLAKTDERLVIANDGIRFRDFSIEYSVELDEMGRDIKSYPCWPTHPVFSYSTDKKKNRLGNSCPLLTSYMIQYELPSIGGFYRELQFAFDYLGRYGEKAPDDGMFSIKLNDEEIINGEGVFFDNPEELLNGVVDATIVNEMVLVDDITGSNKAQLHYIAGVEDETPPTMTMLHFKDSNADVTDRFAVAEKGVLEFSASDFNFMLTPLYFVSFNRQPPESVEVSFSPYGEDNWNDLPVEEIPENYWPVMGWFYRGSLAGVTGEAYEGWFDLKIRLVDAAGNWQEQVISPAFRIDDLAYTSVATITPASKSGDSAIYNLAGQRMRGDLNTLPHGIYIVNGKKVVK